MKSQLDQLDSKLIDLIDETNRWEVPKGMESSDRRDGHDYIRGAFAAFMYIRGQVKSIRRKRTRASKAGKV
jgi:hypothetical protein